MPAHEFLSPEWQEAARALRDEYLDRIPAPPFPVRANLVILEAPFQNPKIDAHVDTASGHAFPDIGHVDNPEMTVTLTYATAKTLFFARDAQAMQKAFMSGQIRIDGDMTRMMFLFDFDPDAASDPLAEEIDARLQAITL